MIIVTFSMFSIVIGMFNPRDTEGLIAINVAYQTDFAGTAVYSISENLDFFEEEGLEVTFVPFISEQAELTAITSGDIQIGYFESSSPLFSPNSSINIIAYQNIGNSEVIITNKENEFKSVKDLKNKIVATPFGSIGEDFLNFIIENNKINKNDLDVINMDINGCLTALIDKKVDAVSVWDSYRYVLEERMGVDFQILENSLDYNSYFSISSWVAKKDYILANQSTVEAFARGLSKSLDYWGSHQEQVAGWSAQLLDRNSDLISSKIYTYEIINSKQL